MPDIYEVPRKEEEKKIIPERIRSIPHSHPFASFCENPLDFWFQTKEDDEEVLLLLRRHFVTNISWIFIVFVLIIFPFGAVIAFTSMGFANPLSDIIPQNYLLPLSLLYFIAILSYGLINFMSWFYNVSLVTNKRIVDIDFSNLVYHDVAATKLDLVQDVDYAQIGVLRSIFNYGDVFVRTASKSDNFDFLAVPKPTQVSRIIENLIGRNP
jgi:hypothetical protein